MKRVLAVLPVLFAARTAAAAIPAPCVPPSLTPNASAFPANLPGLAYDDVNARSGSIVLREYVDQTPSNDVPITTSVVDKQLKIVPTGGFVAGKRYLLNWQPPCYNQSQPQLEFTVEPAAPLPTQIGTLQGDVTATSKDFGTGKFEIVGRYDIAAELVPWLAVYEFGVEVDGRVVETHKTVAATNVFQFNGSGWCDATNAAITNHTVKIRARLPFAPIIETAATSVAFTCSAGEFSNFGASTPVPPNGVTPTTGASSTTSSSSSSSSGGCSLTPSRTSSTLSILGIGLGLVALVRRGMRKVS